MVVGAGTVVVVVVDVVVGGVVDVVVVDVVVVGASVVEAAAVGIAAVVAVSVLVADSSLDEQATGATSADRRRAHGANRMVMTVVGLLVWIEGSIPHPSPQP